MLGDSASSKCHMIRSLLSAEWHHFRCRNLFRWMHSLCCVVSSDESHHVCRHASSQVLLAAGRVCLMEGEDGRQRRMTSHAYAVTSLSTHVGGDIVVWKTPPPFLFLFNMLESFERRSRGKDLFSPLRSPLSLVCHPFFPSRC